MLLLKHLIFKKKSGIFLQRLVLLAGFCENLLNVSKVKMVAHTDKMAICSYCFRLQEL
jgi:hypothetical protein